MKHDIEWLLLKVETFLKAGLNSQLSALDTEKNDGITLAQVAAASYHLQDMDEGIELGDPYVLIEEHDEPKELQSSGGPGTAITYRIAIWLVLTDQGAEVQRDTMKRLFRYRRAMKDLFEASWETAVPGYKFQVNQMGPSPKLKDARNEDWTGRAVGVVVTTTIA